MWTRQHRQRNTGRLIVPVLCAAFLTYFGYHAYHGEFGLDSKQRVDARMAELQRELETVRKERTQLEHRVQLLHDGTMDKDMLDEYARRALNVADPDEIIIMLDRPRRIN